MDALRQIRKPIELEMERYKQLYDSLLHHSNPILNKVLPVVAQRKGKMMRPILTLLSAKLLGEINEKTIYSAASLEFFHTASLLHDDVVDESDERRGQASINCAFGNKVAVLVGDYLLAQCLYCASKTDSPRLVESISVAAQNLADGELLQLNSIGIKELSEDTYYSIIKNKTAALFAACTESGAMSVSSEEMDIFSLKKFGELVGICFQIRDDIFDYSKDSSIGKPTGIDMREGKLTLPAIYVLNTTQNVEMLAIASKIKDGQANDEEIGKLVDFTVENGGLDYAFSAMKKIANEAVGLLNSFPDSEAKQSLINYVSFVVDRTI